MPIKDILLPLVGEPGAAAIAAIDKCIEMEARLLVIDTVGPFSGLGGEAENQQGAARETIGELAAARNEGEPLCRWRNLHRDSERHVSMGRLSPLQRSNTLPFVYAPDA